MAMGGVAYYLSLFESNKSVAQNIQQLCFTRGGELTEEFDRLFRSLFKKARQSSCHSYSPKEQRQRDDPTRPAGRYRTC